MAQENEYYRQNFYNLPRQVSDFQGPNQFYSSYMPSNSPPYYNSFAENGPPNQPPLYNNMPNQEYIPSSYAQPMQPPYFPQYPVYIPPSQELRRQNSSIPGYISSIQEPKNYPIYPYPHSPINHANPYGINNIPKDYTESKSKENVNLRLIEAIYKENYILSDEEDEEYKFSKNKINLKNLEEKQNFDYQIVNEQNTGHAKKIPLETYNQVSKSICKIFVNSVEGDKTGTGFFLKYQKEKKINFVITNCHIISQKLINLKYSIIIITKNGYEQIIELDDKKRFIICLEAPIDITAIEILDKDELYNGIEFLSYDLNYEEGYRQYLKSDVFSLEHPLGKDAECASGKIIKINNNREFEFEHTIDTDYGSSGSPIILAGNTRVIGIHKANNKTNNNNLGTFIGILLQKISESFNNITKIKDSSNKNEHKDNFSSNCEKEITSNTISNEKTNKIIMIYKANNKNSNKIRILGDKFVKNNEENCIIVVNGKNIPLCTHINMQLINKPNIKIELKEIKTVSNMSYIFERCDNLLYITDKSEWDTSNVKDMSFMFCGCRSLKNITNNFSKWNTSNVIDMSGMFYLCKEITYLPDISKWNTSNTKNIAAMFQNCSSLSYLPDISNWDTSKVTNMLSLFSKCSSLSSLPDISKWNVSNVTNMNGMFAECSSLKNIPDISNWDVSNVTDMRYMFFKCENLLEMPDISKWHFSMLVELMHIFDDCAHSSEVAKKLADKYEIK